MHVVSAGPTDVDFHAGGNNSYSTTAAGQGQSPHKGTTVGASSAIPVLSPAALFTDDCLHPLHYFVCQSLASQVRSLPVVSVDSNSLQMRHKKNEQEDSSAFSPGKPEALLSLNAFQQEHRLDQELSAVGFNCNSSTGNSGIKTQQRQDDPDWWPAADFLKVYMDKFILLCVVFTSVFFVSACRTCCRGGKMPNIVLPR